jgi:hypothetical protein
MVYRTSEYRGVDIDSYVGGRFSLLESFRRGGTGSPRVIYKGGLSVFDDIMLINEALPFCSLECCKKGFMIRMGKRDKFAEAGFTFTEVRRLTLQMLRQPDHGLISIYPIYRGRLVVYADDLIMRFDIQPYFFKRMKKFILSNFDERKVEIEELPTSADQTSI